MLASKPFPEVHQMDENHQGTIPDAIIQQITTDHHCSTDKIFQYCFSTLLKFW